MGEMAAELQDGITRTSLFSATLTGSDPSQAGQRRMHERAVAFRELFRYYQPRDRNLNIDLGGIASCSHAHRIKKKNWAFFTFLYRLWWSKYIT